jgi:hypothetical protein
MVMIMMMIIIIIIIIICWVYGIKVLEEIFSFPPRRSALNSKTVL